MTNEIGEFAGIIWDLLSQKGSLSVAQLKKETKGDDFMVAAAIGWLAREDKLNINKSGKTIKVVLQ